MFSYEFQFFYDVMSKPRINNVDIGERGDASLPAASMTICRGSWVVGRGRGSWVWVVDKCRG